MKRVQLFTAGEMTCEIDDYLVDYFLRADCIELKTKDENGNAYFHIFPLHNVSMLRIFDEKQD